MGAKVLLLFGLTKGIKIKVWVTHIFASKPL